MVLLFRDVLRLGTQCVRCLSRAQVDTVRESGPALGLPLRTGRLPRQSRGGHSARRNPREVQRG